MRIKRLVGAAVAAAIGTAAVAAPASADPNPYKDLCKNGGYASYGFQNQGQCVAAANHGTFTGGGGVSAD